MGKKQTLKKESRKGRKYIFGALSGFGLAATLAGFFYFNSQKDPTFEYAKKHPEKREAYVESVEEKFRLKDIPGVGDVRYVKGEGDVNEYQRTEPEGKPTMKTILEGKMPGGEYDLEIYDWAFNADLTENDFLSILIDHEAQGHAKPFHFAWSDIGYFDDEEFVSEDGTKINLELFSSVYELYALRNQIRKGPERGVDKEFLIDVSKTYWMHFSRLIQPDAEKGLKRPESVKKFRIEFFIPELMHHTVTIENQYSGPLITEDGKMITSFGPVELPDYLKEKVESWKRK